MVIHEFDKKFFRLSSQIRGWPPPGEDWTQFHRETKYMMMRFLKERTSASDQQIAKLFGLNHLNNIRDKLERFVDEDTYLEFLKRLLDLLY